MVLIINFLIRMEREILEEVLLGQNTNGYVQNLLFYNHNSFTFYFILASLFQDFLLRLLIVFTCLTQLQFIFDYNLYFQNHWGTLKSVIRSISQNVDQLLQACILMTLYIWIHGVFGFYFIDDTYYDGRVDYEQGERTCSTLAQCFATTMNYGLRNGGGIGESIASQSFQEDNKYRFIFKWAFEVTFFIGLQCIGLNIIFGIIIQTFAVILKELRDDDEKIRDDMHNRCFICGIDRFKIDRHADGGFKNHIKNEHHLWNYLFFMYRITTQVEKEEYDGIESYVVDKIDNNDIKWFPIDQAKCFEESSNAKEEKNLFDLVLEQTLENLKKICFEIDKLQN